MRPCNANDLTQEFLSPLQSIPVRNSVNIIVHLPSIVVTLPQFYRSQFGLQSCQSVRIALT
jgi:hypothetical protein